MTTCRRVKYSPLACFVEIGEKNLKARISSRTLGQLLSMMHRLMAVTWSLPCTSH